MDVDDLRALIAEGEHRELEFKRGLSRKDDKVICKEIAALAATNGGKILIGVEDNGNICGVPDPANVATRAASWISDCIDPSPEANIFKIKCPEGTVIVVSVDSGAHPIYLYDGQSFTRVGSASQRMSATRIVDKISAEFKDQVKLLSNELIRLRDTDARDKPNSLKWRQTSPGLRGRMYIEVASSRVNHLITSMRGTSGVQSVRIHQNGPDRTVCVVELPAAAEIIQQLIADKTIAAALRIDPTVRLV